ncbi:unnamed protein product [Cyprideis torosa]|uniref:Uncharacterized protein n=1 Tax=Cyprideis torosa TaxID=163714 RepID=A0A7R8WF50_9CRUS|nr:unnamed protein product [Cyprideis torosa]CAG0890228.1 unnamed protein product [Cyprideis torosa]
MRQEKERERLLGLPPGSGPTSAEEVSAEKEVNVQVQASQQRQRMVSTPQQIQVQSSRPQSAVVTCQSGTQLQNILPLAIQSAGGISSPSSCSTPLLSIVSSAPNVILTKSTAVASCSSTGFPMTTSGTGGVHPATITISQAQALANCSAASGGTVVSINRRPLAPNQQTTRFKVHSNPAGIVTGSNATSGIVASSANVTYLTAPNLVSGLTAQQQQLALQKRRQTYSQQIRVEGSPANVSIGSPSPHSIAAATPTPAAAPPT